MEHNKACINVSSELLSLLQCRYHFWQLIIQMSPYVFEPPLSQKNYLGWVDVALHCSVHDTWRPECESSPPCIAKSMWNNYSLPDCSIIGSSLSAIPSPSTRILFSSLCGWLLGFHLQYKALLTTNSQTGAINRTHGSTPTFPLGLHFSSPLPLGRYKLQ